MQDWVISETPEGIRWRAVLDAGLRIRLTSIRFDDGTRGLQLDEIRDRGQVTPYFGNDAVAATTISILAQQS